MQNPHIFDQKTPDTNDPPDITPDIAPHSAPEIPPEILPDDTTDLRESAGALVYGSKEPLLETYSGRVISMALLASHGFVYLL